MHNTNERHDLVHRFRLVILEKLLVEISYQFLQTCLGSFNYTIHDPSIDVKITVLPFVTRISDEEVLDSCDSSTAYCDKEVISWDSSGPSLFLSLLPRVVGS